jgi:hypothetical protein
MGTPELRCACPFTERCFSNTRTIPRNQRKQNDRSEPDKEDNTEPSRRRREDCVVHDSQVVTPSALSPPSFCPISRHTLFRPPMLPPLAPYAPPAIHYLLHQTICRAVLFRATGLPRGYFIVSKSPQNMRAVANLFKPKIAFGLLFKDYRTR